MSALHYTGKNDTREQGFMINTHQEQALLLTLLQGRDPTYTKSCTGSDTFATSGSDPPAGSRAKT